MFHGEELRLFSSRLFSPNECVCGDKWLRAAVMRNGTKQNGFLLLTSFSLSLTTSSKSLSLHIFSSILALSLAEEVTLFVCVCVFVHARKCV